MHAYSYTGILTPCFVCAGEGVVEGNDVGVPWVFVCGLYCTSRALITISEYV